MESKKVSRSDVYSLVVKGEEYLIMPLEDKEVDYDLSISFLSYGEDYELGEVKKIVDFGGGDSAEVKVMFLTERPEGFKEVINVPVYALKKISKEDVYNLLEVYESSNLKEVQLIELVKRLIDGK